LTPTAQPSCIAEDDRSAFMGASSGHAAGVNVLFLDGSVRTCTPQVYPKIWREWAALPEAPREAPASP
jgi:prepilin-type processing-associated H-X9-DG protein